MQPDITKYLAEIDDTDLASLPIDHKHALIHSLWTLCALVIDRGLAGDLDLPAVDSPSLSDSQMPPAGLLCEKKERPS